MARPEKDRRMMLRVADLRQYTHKKTGKSLSFEYIARILRKDVKTVYRWWKYLKADKDAVDKPT